MASRRQLFTPCKLYIDGADGLSAGDYILTSGGSAYLVQVARPSPSRPDRLYLGGLGWPPRDSRGRQVLSAQLVPAVTQCDLQLASHTLGSWARRRHVLLVTVDDVHFTEKKA